MKRKTDEFVVKRLQGYVYHVSPDGDVDSGVCGSGPLSTEGNAGGNFGNPLKTPS
jgi:hypothetical protein